MQVDLGCGLRKKEGFIGIDMFKFPGVDIVADLNKGIPLKDDSVDYLYTSHFLEHVHVKDLYQIMDEIYRVCKPDVPLEIIVPHFSKVDDSEFHNRRFKYDCLHDYDVDRVGSPMPYFKVISRNLEFVNNSFSKIFANNYRFYEKHLWWLIPCKQVHIMFQVDKNKSKGERK